MDIRVRFAPSPTGYLHIGGVRTALYNWLFARHTAGRFVLRIEDTDKSRSSQAYSKLILEGFSWLGLDIDEGPFYQSDRMALYTDFAKKLLAAGRAYKCFCSPQEIEARKQAKGVFQYDRFCLERRDNPQGPYAVRFRVPEGDTLVHDMVRGDIAFNNDQFEDFVILRSDGTPTYHFAVVVDDALMRMSHIIRGDDHISNTPKQILLYQALGFDVPAFAHLPMILGGDGKRLSKRTGATSLKEYQDMGILPQALLNYLARLGWSHGDKEIFSLKELISLFSLDQVGSSAAVFDLEKLLWVNSLHMKNLTSAELLDRLLPLLEADHPMRSLTREQQERLAALYCPRAKTLLDLVKQSSYIYSNTYDMDEKAVNKFFKPQVKAAFEHIVHNLETCAGEDDIETLFRTTCKTHDIKLGKLAQAVRIGLTGSTRTPGLFEIIDLIGIKESARRLQHSLSLFQGDPS